MFGFYGVFVKVIFLLNFIYRLALIGDNRKSNNPSFFLLIRQHIHKVVYRDIDTFYKGNIRFQYLELLIGHYR